MSSPTCLIVVCFLLAITANVESLRFVRFSTVTDSVSTTITETSNIDVCVSFVDVTGACRRRRDIIEPVLIAASPVKKMEATAVAQLGKSDNSVQEGPQLSSSFGDTDHHIDYATLKELLRLKNHAQGRLYLKPVITITVSPNKVTTTTTVAANFYVMSGCTPPIIYHPEC